MADSLSEQYRLTAKSWVELDAAASLLEECKSANLSQMMLLHTSIAVNRAEILCKASPAWTDYLSQMVEARRKANVKKVEAEFLKMRFQEQMSEEATSRSERRL